MTKPYTPPHFYEELRGISDGAQIDYMELVRVQMLPELIQAACSMYGAWGPAIKNGTLLQLRALDWEVHGPFQQVRICSQYQNDNSSIPCLHTILTSRALVPCAHGLPPQVRQWTRVLHRIICRIHRGHHGLFECTHRSLREGAAKNRTDQ